MIPVQLLVEPVPAPDPSPSEPPMGTICVGADLHQLVAPKPDGSIIGDLIKANHPDCPGYIPGLEPKPKVTKEEAVAVIGIGTLFAMLMG